MIEHIRNLYLFLLGFNSAVVALGLLAGVVNWIAIGAWFVAASGYAYCLWVSTPSDAP